MVGHLKDLLRLSGGEWLMSFTTRGDAGKVYERLKDADVEIEIRKITKPRSRDANAFCWALCTDIGKAITPPVPKEEVYRKAIREVGVYQPMPIKAEAVEWFQRKWQMHGTGWFAEVVDDSKIPDYKLVFAYFGSSTYDTAEMSNLIDYLIDEAQQMNLPIPAKKEQEEMLKAWGG